MRINQWASILALAWPVVSAAADPTIIPLPQAHAHNDYRHARPLLDALDQGFCSVEADIFLVDDQLLVGHDRSELRSGRTLQSLYLDPLRQRARQNNGHVYPGGPTITLLVDIKADGAKTYAVLRKTLASYKDILWGVVDGQAHPGPVQVVISGDRPQQDIAADAERYAGIDGRLSDLDTSMPAHLMPMISDRWSSHFRWQGDGDFPPAEQEKLDAIVQQAHAAGRRVRFWATPEKAAVWKVLASSGVDHLNTDRLEDLRQFLLRR